MTTIHTLIALTFCSMFTTSLFAAEGTLLPSEITVLANHAIRANPDAARTDTTAPLTARMQTEDLPEIEQFMKGEVHFLNLQPEESRDEFWNFRTRDDDIGRVANQRLMIIRINAFSMVDELLNTDIPRYRERFGSRADDRYGITFPISRTAQQLITRGDADEALDLIIDEVRRHDQFDAPYSAYALAGQFFTAARENGRIDDFIELHAWVMDGLNRAIEERLEKENSQPERSDGVPGRVFFSLFEDQQKDYLDWTAEMIRLRDQMEAGAASAR